MDSLQYFTRSVLLQINKSIDSLDYISLQKVKDIILEVEGKGNRLHITGIGKPGHLAGYIASLLSSTGTPCYFLHGTEAVHGSCGQLCHGDAVICISNSGETTEMKETIKAIRNNGGIIIGVTGKENSWLAQESDYCLFASINEEGGHLNRAPRNSILAEMIVLQSLSVLLQEAKDLSPEDYVRRHPGGTLGKLREDEIFEKEKGCCYSEGN